MEFLAVHTKECLRYTDLSNKVLSISADLWNDTKKIRAMRFYTMSPQVTRGFELKDLSMYNLPIYFNSPHGMRYPNITTTLHIDICKFGPL